MAQRMKSLPNATVRIDAKAAQGPLEWWRERRATVGEQHRYARLCRVERVMRPSIEALLEAFAA